MPSQQRVLELMEKTRRAGTTSLPFPNLGIKVLPPEIGNLINLTNLDLSGNQLDALPPEIGNLINLTNLDLSGNQLHALPPEIGNLTNLTELHLRSNQLKALPPEIGNLLNLTALHLTYNQLHVLPPEIGNLTNLTWLVLDGNQLESLPPEVGNLTNLIMLDLHGNQLKSLPPEVGNLTNLTWVVLNGNQLEAQPPEIGNLTSLTVLDLGRARSPSDWSYWSWMSSAHASLVEEFGPFAQVFELGGPSYPCLLNMNSPKCQVVFQLIQTAIESGENPGSFICRLLAHINWRLHLIGAVAVLLHNSPREFAQSLWYAIDAGSWVAPQLVVTVFLIDPEFIEQAKRRIELACPVSLPESLSPLHRHVVTGSGGAAYRSAKTAASLLGILDCIKSEAAWVATQRSDPAIHQLLGEVHASERVIANQWLSKVCHEFSLFGVVLTPSASK